MTRHLTARDHQLIDALERDPRYANVARVLRPPAPKDAPKVAQKTEPKPEPRAEPKPEAPEVEKPTPKPPPAPGHAVGGMTTKDAPSLGGKGR
jgi:hypothetical protein